MLIDGIDGLENAGHDLCVIGAGPVGLALAVDLARRGRRVLVLESGGEAADARVQQLGAADIVDPARHDDMAIATARRLGGTSNLWGARCLPLDPIDFEPRPWVDARWPIGWSDIAPFLPAAVEATRSGAPVYQEPVEGLAPADDRFTMTALERWANTQAAQAIHAEAIRRDLRLELRTHATLTGLRFGPDGRVAAIEVAHSLSGARIALPVGTLVIATGGVETARLLLAARADRPDRFGGEDGPLGRFYMGHLIGEIAQITFASDAADRAFGFHVDAHGSYVRRRFTPSPALQREHRLLNSALWPVVPPIADAVHGNAALSLVYLGMRWGPLGRLVVAEQIRRLHAPDPAPPLWPHVRNLLTGAPAAAAFGVDFVSRRYGRRTRLPGFFVRNRARRYGLSFHAEQLPSFGSSIRLNGRADRLGVAQVAVDLRFHPDDAQSVVRTHDLLERWLASTGLGTLTYQVAHSEREAATLAKASHGTHQIGAARMGAHRREGVVDGDGRCFDASNLFLAGSAVLPTSGQANPTLTTIALALRQALLLAKA